MIGFVALMRSKKRIIFVVLKRLHFLIKLPANLLQSRNVK